MNLVKSRTCLAGNKIDPWHGSYHWIYERVLSIANFGLFGAAFMTTAPNRLIDLAIGIVLPLHCHLGIGTIITDYLPKRKFPTIYSVARVSLMAVTVGAIYGLYQYNTRDVGICEGIGRLWKAKPKETDQ